MSRSVIVAILAFGLLIVVNMAAFGLIGFGTLSERLVTERLVEGLNEAAQAAQMEMADQLASYNPNRPNAAPPPNLARFRFLRTITLYDPNGNPVRRWQVTGSGLIPERAAPTGAQTERGEDWRRIQVGGPANGDGGQMTVEYDQSVIQQEVTQLRREFLQRMAWAIGISLLLLCAGLAYVITAYRRGKRLEEEARKADRMAYVGTLSSGLAHEIRNPLNSMNMNVQLIEEELEDLGIQDDSEIRDMLEGTRREVGRLERLVSSFLAYARPTQLDTTPRALNEVVNEVLGFLEGEIRENQIVLETQFADGLPDLPLDGEQMKQALLNVIQNAVSVMQPGGRLLVTTRRAAGDNLLVTVADQGPGISPEELKNIFKVFYSTRLGGTGLGLPIAQRIVELHGGGIKVDSQMGQGTTFTFILPLPREES